MTQSQTRMKADTQSAIILRLLVGAKEIGMTELAKRTGIQREALYRMLGHQANPLLGNVCAIAEALNLQIFVEEIK